MSNKGLIIEERSRDIGDFLVGRLLPFRKKRMVGPFIFIDHMGPEILGNGKYMDIDRHPHIGLSTLTYLLEGEMIHEDSIGTKQLISAGSVNWMVAGKGVTHTERTPNSLRNDQTFRMHGYQIWVALPVEKELIAPEFYHFEPKELPGWLNGSASFKLIAGEGYGKKSPVPVHSDLFMIEIKNNDIYPLNVQGELEGEIGICIVKGAIEACGNLIEEGSMLVSKMEDVCRVVIQPNSHLLLFGGKPFHEERHMYWNFVSSDNMRLEAAKEAWRLDNFPKITGDNTYIKMPE